MIMVVGVNGVGKTTTIGKLAYQFKKAGKKVYLGHRIHSVRLQWNSWKYGLSGSVFLL